MLATKAWIYGQVSAYAPLLTVVGSDDRVVDARPEIIESFPLVVLTDEDQRDTEYADNVPFGSMVRVKADIFTDMESATTTAIATPLCALFLSLGFHCSGNGEVPDPSPDVRHRVLRFSREVFPSDVA